MMTQQDFYYMSQCNKNGIRIYPVPIYGKYVLYVEYNKSSEFLAHEVIQIKPGQEKYDPNKPDWTLKILELYHHLYDRKIMPKLGAA